MHYLTLQNFESRQRTRLLALGGFICLIPALLLITGGILQSAFGIMGIGRFLDQLGVFNVIHPILVLGGIALAILLNLLPTTRLRFVRQDETVTATLVLKERFLNLTLIGLCGLSLFIIFIYLLAENFQIFARI